MKLDKLDFTIADGRRSRVEELSFAAEQAKRRGADAEARRLYGEAAIIEECVALDVPDRLPRTRGVLSVSACALWEKAGEPRKAFELSKVFLARSLPEQARRQLIGFAHLARKR